MKASKYLVFIAVITFFACKEQTKTIVTSAFKDGKPKIETIYKIKDTSKIKIAEKGFYDNGKVRYKGSFDEKGKRTGKWQYFFKSGKLWSMGYFKNGIRQGASVVYYKNGQKRMQGSYFNGKHEGIWKFWSKQGNLLKSLPFKNDTIE